MSRPAAKASMDAVTLVDDLLVRAVGQRASDVHFEPGAAGLLIRFRIDGVLQDVDRLPGTVAENVVARLKVLAGLLTYRVDVPQEGSFLLEASAEGLEHRPDVRIATFPTIHGERAVARFLYGYGRVTDLYELGLADDCVGRLREAAARPDGLMLVTGPAGAGKSTTLYAIARHILAVTPGRSVVSLEDPVEQRVEGMTQIQVQPYGELNYVRAMRSLLRQDVQVLLVGEIRDAETAHLVTEAALTGHLVLSTLHSGDPAEAIARLIEMGIAPYQVVSALSLVSSQRLLREVCGDCRGTGCETCNGIGYRGRTACAHVATMNEALRAAVLTHAPTSELRRIVAEGGTDLLTDARRLLAAGLTNEAEVKRVLGHCDANQDDNSCPGLNTKA